MKPNPFLGAFLGPACLVLLVNIIVLVRLRGLIVQTFDKVDTQETAPETQEQAEEDETAALSEHYQNTAAIESLPNRQECMDHVVGCGLVLLLIQINVLCAIIFVGYQRKLYLKMTFTCFYALSNVLLGAVIFVFHCGRKSKVRLVFGALCKGNCCTRKRYNVENSVNCDDVGDSETTVTAPLMNGSAGGHVYEEISPVHHVHGATSAGSDNVSLPSSAALTIDRQLSFGDRRLDNEPSSSDKHSCVSAPLPLRYSQHSKDRPPVYRHSFCDGESVFSSHKKHKEIKTLDFSALAPLALPESMTPSSRAAHSSRESVPKQASESHDNKAPSDRALSERSIGEGTLQKNEQSSRTPSEVTMPPRGEKNSTIAGASSEISIDGKPTYLMPRRQKPFNFMPVSSKEQQYKLVPKQAYYASPPVHENPVRAKIPVNGVIYDFPQGSAPHNLPYNAQQQYHRQNYHVPVIPSEMNPRQRPRGNSTDSEAMRDKKNTQDGGVTRQDSAKLLRTTSTRETKEVRPKPEPKDWIPPSPKFVYVPVPHILKKQKQTHSETSV